MTINYYIHGFLNIFNYKNKATRSELNYFLLCMFILWLIISISIIYANAIHGGLSILSGLFIFMIFSKSFFLVHEIPLVALVKRRCNSIFVNSNSMFYIWLSIFIVQVIVFIMYFLCFEHVSNDVLAYIRIMFVDRISSLIFLSFIIFLMFREKPIYLTDKFNNNICIIGCICVFLLFANIFAIQTSPKDNSQLKHVETSGSNSQISQVEDYNNKFQIKQKKKHIVNTFIQISMNNNSQNKKCDLTSSGLANCFSEDFSAWNDSSRLYTDAFKIEKQNGATLYMLDGSIYTFVGDGICKRENSCSIKIDVVGRGYQSDMIVVPVSVDENGYIKVHNPTNYD